MTIPTITQEHLSVEMIHPTQLADLGPGGETFKKALASWNANRHEEAAVLYEQALREGLTSLAQGASHCNLAQLALRRRRLREAVDHFIAILKLKTATYDSVNDAAQYLSLMLTELARSKEAESLKELASRAQARLGYSLREEEKVEIRRLVREHVDTTSKGATAMGSVGTCRLCGTRMAAQSMSAAMELMQSGQVEQLKALATVCRRCEAVQCTGCAHGAGGRCPTCRGEVEPYAGAEPAPRVQAPLGVSAPDESGSPTRFKVCKSCGKHVRIVDATCWNCGSVDFEEATVPGVSASLASMNAPTPIASWRDDLGTRDAATDRRALLRERERQIIAEWKRYDETYPVVAGAYRPPDYEARQREFNERLRAVRTAIEHVRVRASDTGPVRASEVVFGCVVALGGAALLVWWLWTALF